MFVSTFGGCNFGQTFKVKLLAIDRVVFETPIASVYEHTKRRTNHNCCCIRNRVVHTDKLNAKVITYLHAFMRFWIHFMVIRLEPTGCFFHSSLYHPKRKLDAINKRRNSMRRVAIGSNVVKVSMSKHLCTDFVLVFL